jgi:DNA-binding transcriptional LysR family regulator
VEQASHKRRWAELVLLFGLMPLVLSRGPRWAVLPTILAGGTLCLALLLVDPSFQRRRLWDAAGARRGWMGLLVRTVAVWTGILLFALVQRGVSGLFLFPRARPGIWLGVVILYPSSRSTRRRSCIGPFFFHRYASLFRTPRR